MIDDFTPVYLALMERGIDYASARGMDISLVGAVLGVAATESVPEDEAEAPLLAADGSPAPATAPAGMKPPSWWKGNAAAFQSMKRGAVELGEGWTGG